MQRPREWFYPEVSTVGRALRWQDRQWEIQYDRNVPQRALPGKVAKAAPSPTTRVGEGQVQPREPTDEGGQAMDFERYTAFFALSPEAQA